MFELIDKFFIDVVRPVVDFQNMVTLVRASKHDECRHSEKKYLLHLI